ncbi:MAG: hypothetical protein A2589_03810 [Candidatus Vogelbacteria bacterium RIFOXYD1_FULL_46_19]|uniref:HTH deoR-type domain-containing protein n=1 Tax=Candidatus Vogelbacteria bacterium RIFOXYD1_FULL_46_19 TaxID=1802439 RepID=A0A1G2QJY9_9BACT|nr:MAG: hypothetical protein A2589_03810 [Candidatus Vogelbacteria bacterium RIFOXYD1_FULL_46_19]
MEKDSSLSKGQTGERQDQIAVLDFVLAKNERLASALYMVTGFMPDSEPLKWRLREVTVAVFTDINRLFADVSTLVKKDKSWSGYLNLDEVVGAIGQIVSLIGLALSANTASQMNLTILKSEYENLAKTLADNFSSAGLNHYLLSGRERYLPLLRTKENFTSSFLSAPTASGYGDLATRPISNPRVPADQLTGDKSSYRTNVTPQSAAGLSRPGAGSAATGRPPAGRSSIGQGDQASDKASRRGVILKYLEGRPWTSIKDIARAVPDCSVKTVQRELVELVDTGVLKKTGERRWSRYQLA